MVRGELNNFNAYEDTVAGLVAESLSSIKSESLLPEHKATYLFILWNLMSEMQPFLDEGSSSRDDFKRLFEKIRDAKINVSNDVKQERLKALFDTPDFSKTAEDVLKAKFPDKKK